MIARIKGWIKRGIIFGRDLVARTPFVKTRLVSLIALVPPLDRRLRRIVARSVVVEAASCPAPLYQPQRAFFSYASAPVSSHARCIARAQQRLKTRNNGK